MTSSFFEIRLFYVRTSPCSVDTVPSFLTLSHLRRPVGVSLEINGSKIPSSDHTSLLLRRDRIDRGSSEVTYVSTDGVKLTGAVDFEVGDDKGNLILCGSLDKMEAAWSNGSIGSVGDKDPKTGWSMDCYMAASISGSGFVQPKLGIVNPLVEVYVAGCFGGVPLILTQTVMVSPRRKARPGILDSIPEERGERENGRSDVLVCQRTMTSLVRKLFFLFLSIYM